MPIKFVSGDLFDNAHHAKAFAQGCNCQGSMGAGIAKTFRSRYPDMYDEYRRWCKAEPRQFNLEDCWLWKTDNQPWVFNLGTQERYWRARASYEAIETSLRSMRKQADAEGVSRIAMSHVGVGWRAYVEESESDQTLARRLTPEDGEPETNLSDAETRLGLRLPSVLRSFRHPRSTGFPATRIP